MKMLVMKMRDDVERRTVMRIAGREPVIECAWSEERRLHHTLLAACQAAGTMVCGSLKHEFHPQGFSSVVLVGASHASVHTFPEDGYFVVTFLSCGKEGDVGAFRQYWLDSGYLISDERQDLLF